MSARPRRPDPITRFAGWIVVAAGTLMLGLSGLCCLTVVGDAFGRGVAAVLNVAGIAAISGGPAMIAGSLVARWGLLLLRTASQPRRGETDVAQVVAGALLIVVAAGGLVKWALMAGPFSYPPQSDAFFYGVILFGGGALIAGGVGTVGVFLLLGARPPSANVPD